MNTHVFTTYSPYTDRAQPAPDTTDGRDRIYGSDGAALLLSPATDGHGGYTAEFSVGVSRSTSQLGNTSAGGGGPATGAAAVGDHLRSAVMTRTALGTRRLRLTITAAEPVTATARLTRSGHRLAYVRTKLSRGTGVVRVTIPSAVPAGAARLTLTLADASGRAKTYTRTVHVHRRLTG
jgi:hypothetical protein